MDWSIPFIIGHPNPGSPLKSIEKACALWTYAIDRKPLDRAMVNNIDIVNLLYDFMYSFHLSQCEHTCSSYQKPIK